MASVAEFESRRISESMREAMAQAKARGVVFGASRPDVAKLNAARAEKATEVAERYRGILAPMAVRGDSLRAMAVALQAAGVKTSAGAETWSPMQVLRVVKRLKLA